MPIEWCDASYPSLHVTSEVDIAIDCFVQLDECDEEEQLRLQEEMEQAELDAEFDRFHGIGQADVAAAECLTGLARSSGSQQVRFGSCLTTQPSKATFDQPKTAGAKLLSADGVPATVHPAKGVGSAIKPSKGAGAAIKGGKGAGVSSQLGKGAAAQQCKRAVAAAQQPQGPTTKKGRMARTAPTSA